MGIPVLVGEIELTDPIGDLTLPERADSPAYHSVRLLVRVQHFPVGYVDLAVDELDAAAIARRVWQETGAAINRLRVSAGLPELRELPVDGIAVASELIEEPTEQPMVNIVLCTRDRPESVLVTLRGLTTLNYNAYEIVVVDNAPSSDATRNAIAAQFGTDPRVRYVHEPRPGISSARNRGLAETSADIVAFTDDDVRVDPWWLIGLVRGFRAMPGVAAVTGLIATAELESPAQLYFHLRQQWGRNCERRIYDLGKNRDESPLYPYSAGAVGAGANFAVSRTALQAIGGFNEALGAGTPAGGGEDLNMFIRILLAGHSIVYEPSAIVYHVHRTNVEALSRQMRAYGSGCTAALTAIVIDDARARRELPPKVLRGVTHMFKLNSRVRGNSSVPTGLITKEVGGFVVGPLLYLKGLRNIRRPTQAPSPRAA